MDRSTVDQGVVMVDGSIGNRMDLQEAVDG